MEAISRANNVIKPEQHNVTEDPASLNANTASVEKGDVDQFQAALQRRLLSSNKESEVAGVQGTGKNTLGDKIMNRCTSLAGEMKTDQEYVSKLLEQATRTGDSMQMMKAMMALSDYQTRVQFVSKTVSKAASSIDQLTRMQ